MSNDLSNTGIINILLVENSKTARKVLEALLTKAGYNVTTVATGPEAIELLEIQAFHLIVMDLYMPLMNGYEVAEKIRLSNRHYSQVPIVAYTSSQSKKDREICVEAGMNDFFEKGNPKDLLVHLENYLSKNLKIP